MALVCIIVIFNSSFKLSISKLKIDTENGNIDYEIKFRLYFMKKIRIIGLKLNKDKQEKIILEGDLPSPANLPKGCKFHTRCPKFMMKFKEFVPNTSEISQSHCVRCFLYE